MTVQRRNAARSSLLHSEFQPRHDQGYALSRAKSFHQAILGVRGLYDMNNVTATPTLVDSSGQGHTLTYNGNPTFGINGIASILQLDGAGDHLDSTSTDFRISGTETYIDSAYRGLTIGGWFRFDNAAGSIEGMVGRSDNSTNVSYELYRDTGGTIVFRVSNTGAVGAVNSVASTSTPAAGEWFHVVGTYDPSTEVKIFINGVEEASNTTSIVASLFAGTADFTIGGRTGGASLMTGDAALVFVCAANLPDGICRYTYECSRVLFNM